MIWVLFIGTLLISLLASAPVKSTYLRYTRIAVSSGLSGAEAAQEIMIQAGIHNVEPADEIESAAIRNPAIGLRKFKSNSAGIIQTKDSTL